VARASEIFAERWTPLILREIGAANSDPGFGDDLVVRARLEALVRVYLGQLSLANGLRSDQVRIEGPRRLTSTVGDWFPISGFAPHAKAMRYDSFAGSFVQASA
jgi:hypothetical protein